jgi:hypothetical protein
LLVALRVADDKRGVIRLDSESRERRSRFFGGNAQSDATAHLFTRSAKRHIPALRYPLVKFANVEAESERGFGQPGGVK